MKLNILKQYRAVKRLRWREKNFLLLFYSFFLLLSIIYYYTMSFYSVFLLYLSFFSSSYNWITSQCIALFCCAGYFWLTSSPCFLTHPVSEGKLIYISRPSAAARDLMLTGWQAARVHIITGTASRFMKREREREREKGRRMDYEK